LTSTKNPTYWFNDTFQIFIIYINIIYWIYAYFGAIVNSSDRKNKRNRSKTAKVETGAMNRNSILGASAEMPENTPSSVSGPDLGAARAPKRSPDMNVAIGWILQSGVLLSSAVICIGLVLLFVHPEQLASQNVLAFPHTVGEVKSGILALRPQAFITVGLLLLIATPVIRVAASIFAFALEHDRRYVVITTVVLAILLTSFLLGKGGG
jgi:uncharacterized membrane protein